MRHELDLLSNAIDSLTEGLRRYEQAQRYHEVRAYKFVVLHFAHFAELLLKHAVAKQHPLLIYRNPASSKLATESTIGLKDALAILRNAGVHFDQQLLDDLAWLKKLRNDIEHYAFTMDIVELRVTLGRIIIASDALATAAGLADLVSAVAVDCAPTYRRLREAYEAKLESASNAALAECEGSPKLLLDCEVCEENTAVKRGDVVYCHFCKRTHRPSYCLMCGSRERASSMIETVDIKSNEVRYICWDCEMKINAPEWGE